MKQNVNHYSDELKPNKKFTLDLCIERIVVSVSIRMASGMVAGWKITLVLYLLLYMILHIHLKLPKP